MDRPTVARPVPLAILYVVSGVAGLAAAFALTLDKFAVLADPQADLDCNFSLIVQCGANLNSPEGSVFGFPNPLIGLIGFTALLVVGVALLGGTRFPRWFELTFAVGVVAGAAFVVFLVRTSIFVLGTLCPWCMLVWAVMIPTFWATLLSVFGTGVAPAPEPVRRAAAALRGWVPLITLLTYVLIAVLAQLRLDVLAYL